MNDFLIAALITFTLSLSIYTCVTQSRVNKYQQECNYHDTSIR